MHGFPVSMPAASAMVASAGVGASAIEFVPTPVQAQQLVIACTAWQKLAVSNADKCRAMVTLGRALSAIRHTVPHGQWAPLLAANRIHVKTASRAIAAVEAAKSLGIDADGFTNFAALNTAIKNAQGARDARVQRGTKGVSDSLSKMDSVSEVGRGTFGAVTSDRMSDLTTRDRDDLDDDQDDDEDEEWPTREELDREEELQRAVGREIGVQDEHRVESDDRRRVEPAVRYVGGVVPAQTQPGVSTAGGPAVGRPVDAEHGAGDDVCHDGGVDEQGPVDGVARDGVEHGRSAVPVVAGELSRVREGALATRPGGQVAGRAAVDAVGTRSQQMTLASLYQEAEAARAELGALNLRGLSSEKLAAFMRSVREAVAIVRGGGGVGGG